MKEQWETSSACHWCSMFFCVLQRKNYWNLFFIKACWEHFDRKIAELDLYVSCSCRKCWFITNGSVLMFHLKVYLKECRYFTGDVFLTKAVAKRIVLLHVSDEWSWSGGRNRWDIPQVLASVMQKNCCRNIYFPFSSHLLSLENASQITISTICRSFMPIWL